MLPARIDLVATATPELFRAFAATRKLGDLSLRHSVMTDGLTDAFYESSTA